MKENTTQIKTEETKNVISATANVRLNSHKYSRGKFEKALEEARLVDHEAARARGLKPLRMPFGESDTAENAIFRVVEFEKRSVDL